jgi:hypothetical protein
MVKNAVSSSGFQFAVKQAGINIAPLEQFYPTHGFALTFVLGKFIHSHFRAGGTPACGPSSSMTVADLAPPRQ